MSECKECGKRGTLFAQLTKGLCGQCHAEQLRLRAVERLGEEEQALRASRAADPVRSVILTTESAHNLNVTERHGIVTAEVVIGMHVFRDIASSFRDVFGGRSETMQRGLKDARIAALEELQMEAAVLGANAIVGVDLDYSDISGGGKNMLLLVASGTAVTVHLPINTAQAE